MAKITSQKNDLIEAIREMGIEPNMTRKVVIEIGFSEGVHVYVEQLADERVIKVVRALGSEVEVIREVRSDGEE